MLVAVAVSVRCYYSWVVGETSNKMFKVYKMSIQSMIVLYISVYIIKKFVPRTFLSTLSWERLHPWLVWKDRRLLYSLLDLLYSLLDYSVLFRRLLSTTRIHSKCSFVRISVEVLCVDYSWTPVVRLFHDSSMEYITCIFFQNGILFAVFLFALYSSHDYKALNVSLTFTTNEPGVELFPKLALRSRLNEVV